MDVTFERFGTHREFRLPLWQLAPTPEPLRYRQAGSLVGRVIFGLCRAVAVGGRVFSHDAGVAAALVFPLFLFGMLFWACFWKLKTQSIDTLVFHLRSGGQIHVWFEKPDARTFQECCAAWKKQAEMAWESRPVSGPSYSLAGEIVELKKLKDSGALTEAEFEKAKARLIDAADERPIGFNWWSRKQMPLEVETHP